MICNDCISLHIVAYYCKSLHTIANIAYYDVSLLITAYRCISLHIIAYRCITLLLLIIACYCILLHILKLDFLRRRLGWHNPKLLNKRGGGISANHSLDGHDAILSCFWALLRNHLSAIPFRNCFGFGSAVPLRIGFGFAFQRSPFGIASELIRNRF